MRIGYEVHHVEDRPGYLYSVLKERQGNSARRFAEMLTSSAYGTGLVVGVRTGPDVDGRVLFGHADDVAAGGSGTARIFTGSAIPNVSFVYDPTHVFEGMIAIGDSLSPLAPEHGRAIREVMEHVATLAARYADAPIISLQSPVQLPPSEGAGGWPRSSDVAVRFAIAVRRPNAALRLSLLDAAAAFCQERGFGLWVNDLRSGYRAGNWFRICPHRPGTVARFYGVSDDTPRPMWTLPVTLVGPARVGATLATMAYLGSYPEAGVFACTMSIVEDVAFLHLQLGSSVLQGDRVDWVNAEVDRLAGIDTESGRVRETVLPRLLPELVRLLTASPAGDENASKDVLSELNSRVGDFQLLAGPARLIHPASGGLRRALWVSWEIESREEELSLPFLALYDVMKGMANSWETDDPREGQPNMDYLICRRVRHATLRGKGKFSLPEAARDVVGGELPTELSALCERVEAMWKVQLAAALRSDWSARELTVAWREHFLGRWHQPLE